MQPSLFSSLGGDKYAARVQEEPREAQLPPQERVQAVRPFWETLTQEQRVQLLSLSLEDLRAKAADVTARLKRQSGVPPAHSPHRHASIPRAECTVISCFSPQGNCYRVAAQSTS